MIYTYARASADHDESLEEQQRRTSAQAFELGGLVSEAVVEKSRAGGKPFFERPEGGRLMHLLQQGDTLIATKLDRIFRDARNAVDVIEIFDEWGINLILLDLGQVSGRPQTGVQSRTFLVLSAVAEFERNRAGERMRDTKENQRERGAWLGGKRLFGWRRDRQHSTWVEDPDEQKIHTLIHQLRNSTPPRSYSEISDQVARKHGIRLGKSTIAALLKRQPHQRPASAK